jgi:tetratricopeptide (TPR) repeat protein
MKPFVVLLSFFLLSGLSFSCCLGAEVSIDTQFAQCNAAYSRGDYPEATGCYTTLMSKIGYTPALLYNLANSYVHQGEIGKAILNYERALLLKPNDPDILGNLRLVRKNSGLFTGEQSFSQRFFDLLQIHQWAILALVGLFGLTALQVTNYLRSLSRPLYRTIFTLCLLTILCGASGSAYLLKNSFPAVVIKEDSKLLISPFSGAASVGAVKQGRLVRPEKEYEDFVYLQDETGRKGWLSRNAVDYITPPATKRD